MAYRDPTLIVSLLDVTLEVHTANPDLTLKSLLSKKRHQDKNRDKVKILNINRFQAFRGDRYCVVGLNGQGKSTFLRVLSGIYLHTSGEVFNRHPVTPVLAAGIGLEDELTVLENIKLALISRGSLPKERHEYTNWILDFTEMTSQARKQFKHLSTGYKSRLAFAIAVAIHPKVLVLDEVLGGGDARFMKKAEEFLRDLISKTECTFVATHGPREFAGICNKLILIDNGTIAFDGNFEEGLALYDQVISGGLE
jgi:ABC-2 type transport system ATP-binding protein/lipopolysaccharide transport system ATP-binding protein